MIIIFSKFLNLKSEKRERIINAAINEFSQKGFKNSSTDEIVKNADISKGALFHYFINKKTLFLFLYDYILELIKDEYIEKIDLSERDIFKRYRQILLLKFKLLYKYPDMFEFIKAVNMENSEEVKNELEDRNKKITESSYGKLLHNIDKSRFRDDIEIDHTINIIIWTVEGIASKEKAKVKSLPLKDMNFENILAELNNYFSIFEKCFYKN